MIEKENKALQDRLEYLWQRNTVIEGTLYFITKPLPGSTICIELETFNREKKSSEMARWLSR